METLHNTYIGLNRLPFPFFSSRSLPVAWWQQLFALMTSSVPKVVGAAAAGAPVVKAAMVEAAATAEAMAALVAAAL